MAFNKGRNVGKTGHIPQWAATVGALRDNGVAVKAFCTARPEECDFKRDPVDLDLIIADKGEAYSLWDRRPPCPICGRGLLLMYRHGVMRPMRT